MENKESFSGHFKQNEKLAIRLVSPAFGHLPAETAGKYASAHRKSYYFFLLMLEGSTKHRVDLQELEITRNELLFILPNQVHELPQANHGKNYFKLSK